MRWLAIAGGLACAAFHGDTLFADDASVGGGGGNYYTGSPRFKGYTCGACHVDETGRVPEASALYFAIASEPAGLFADRMYEPEVEYTITIAMEGETRGLRAGVNYNTFALEILDETAVPAGRYFGYDGNLLRTSADGTVLLARGQKDLPRPVWTFRWRAPPAGAGMLDLYVSGVDGDGAGESPADLSDPLGDGVVNGRLHLMENGMAPHHVHAQTEGCAASAGGAGCVLFSLVLCRRARRR